ncbi:MAG: hypothetical protein CEO12_363 [Parcubacteria group bacterium Gr01-1014_46]|nr:MAG: hypothetical protein CEO12_363 [Parcubacteria group bacterium Gr01-1014_46]
MIDAIEARRLSRTEGKELKKRAREERKALERQRLFEIREKFFLMTCEAERLVVKQTRSPTGERKVTLDFLPIYGCTSMLVTEVPKPYDELVGRFRKAGYKVRITVPEDPSNPATARYLVLEW